MLTTILTYNVLIIYFYWLAVATVPNCSMHSYGSFKYIKDLVAESSYLKWQLVFAKAEHVKHFLLKAGYTFCGCFLYLCMSMTIYFIKFYLQKTLINSYISQPFSFWVFLYHSILFHISKHRLS
jgi:hypothetical protein